MLLITVFCPPCLNKKTFSRREIASADAARALYRKLGQPDEMDFQSILRQRQINNCPVTPDNAKQALIIYGPDVATIKGKTTCSAAAPRAPTFVSVSIPAPILEHHPHITLCVDFFFNQGMPFLHTVSRGIGFPTVHAVPDRSKATILSRLQSIFHRYQVCGFTLCDVHADNELECIREAILPIALNIVPADSHVGEVERSIRTIKERLRSCAHGLSYQRLPRLMITHMVEDAVRCLNQFPWRNGISQTLSPAIIITGTGPPDYGCMRIVFGTYAQVFEDNDPTNTLRARSLGAIALTPTGNAQGDYHFMSLATEWQPDHPINDYEYDCDYHPVDPAPVVFDATDYEAIGPDEINDLIANGPHILDDPAAPDTAQQGAPADDNDNDGSNDNEGEDEDPGAFVTTDDDGDDDKDPGTDEATDDIADEHNEDQGAFDNGGEHSEDQGLTKADNANDGRDGTDGVANGEDQGANTARPYNLRQRNTNPSSFKHAMDTPHNGKSYYPHPPATRLAQTNRTIFGHLMNQIVIKSGLKGRNKAAAGTLNKHIFGFVMNQMSAKVGIKKHRKEAKAALMKEFLQFKELNAYDPIDVSTLSKSQRSGALRAINLIKEKRDGRLKGRMVADGQPQRALYGKSQTASPIVSTDALMLSSMINAHEARDVATADVAGAYLNAYMDDFVTMKFSSESVDILCKVNPGHSKYVVLERGVKTLDVRLVNALYRCVKLALLWYDLFNTTLKDMGFTINPYDSCVANSMIDGKQCTIAWYVDDNKISHEDKNVVTSVIRKIEEPFGKKTVTRGIEHVFLGMNIRYTKQGTAVITMKDYLKEAISESGMEITGEAVTPAQKCLFESNENSPFLEQHDSEVFHSVVAKLLYVCTSRPSVTDRVSLHTRIKEHTRRQGETQTSTRIYQGYYKS